MFLVRLRQAGPEFDPALPLDRQSGWTEHAAYMESLVEQGHIVLGGTLPAGATAHAFEAASEEDVRAIWARDPWHESHLILESIEPWTIRLDGRELRRPRTLGTFRSENSLGIVRIEDRLDAGIDEVWSALTEPERLARWYGEVGGDLRAGGEFHSRVFASGWEGNGRITECDPPRRLAFVSWEEGRPEHALEVTLTSEGDRTLIVYENHGVPLDLLFAYGAGEQIHVEDLGAHLAGRERDADEARWAALESAYRGPAEKISPQR